MCLAIFRRRDATSVVTEEELQTAYADNPHGFGACWVQDGTLRTWKSVKEKRFTMFCSMVRDLQELNVPLGIHFRFATHGKRNWTNAHPVLVTESLAMLHNGVISGLSNRSDDLSDTNHLAVQLSTLPQGWFDSPFTLRLVESFIGSGNKLVLLRADGAHHIVNESAGHWREGIWFSNYSYKHFPKPVHVPSEIREIGYVDNRSSTSTYLTSKREYTVGGRIHIYGPRKAEIFDQIVFICSECAIDLLPHIGMSEQASITEIDAAGKAMRCEQCNGSLWKSAALPD